MDFSFGEVTLTSKAYLSTIKTPKTKSYGVLTPLLWKQRYIAEMKKEGVSDADSQDYFDDIEFGTKNSVYTLDDYPEEAAMYDVSYYGTA